MTNENKVVPLTFTNPDSGENVVIGTAQIVDTAKGRMILATVGHSQFESLIDVGSIGGLSISGVPAINVAKEKIDGR